MKVVFSSFLLFIAIYSHGQEAITMTTPPHAEQAFADFLKKTKYGPSVKPSFKGIKDKKLKEKMTKYTDKIAMDFKEVALGDQPTDIKYQRKIIYGLGQFEDIKNRLSKEERARVCHYIIELMDIIDLKSSKGQLNLFTYGFDPSTMEIKDK